jgi:hypothetical protein
MSAASLLLDLRRLGIRLEADGERLRYFPRSALTPDLLDQLKAHKADLLALIERFEERAAILEFDAGLIRREAERLAWDDQFSRH